MINNLITLSLLHFNKVDRIHILDNPELDDQVQIKLQCKGIF